MTQPDDEHDGELRQLGVQLDAFDAKRVRQVKSYGEAEGAGEGYRLLAVLIGGVLGGLGLGWLIDHVAHTTPLGLIGGLLIGTAASVYMIARSATRTSGGVEQSRSGSAKPDSISAPTIDDDNGG